MLLLASALASSMDEVLADLIEVEAQLRAGDDAAAARAGLALREDCATLDEPMPQLIAARMMRGIGAGVYLAGQHLEGTDWLRLARHREPSYEWGEGELAADHPLRDLDLSGPITTSLPNWTRPQPRSPWHDPAQMAVERPYCGRDGDPEERPYRIVWKPQPALPLRPGRMFYAGPRKLLDPSGTPFRWVCPPGWTPER